MTIDIFKETGNALLDIAREKNVNVSLIVQDALNLYLQNLDSKS